MFSRQMKLPVNYFMKWFREIMDNETLEFNFHFEPDAKYLDSFLSSEIDGWSPEVPVVISAQTGAGKNHFVLKTLLPKLIDENPNRKDLILILSNRIALNRQTKKKLAELLVEYTHNAKYIEEMERYYTADGVDHIYINFDVVTVCSYHQLYSRCLQGEISSASIDLKKFKYIICDECHFFTSDSSFNENTSEILSGIVAHGQNAVRIYMSATPEVAFEAILLEEFRLKANELSQCIESKRQHIEIQELLNGLNKKVSKKKRRAIEKQYRKLEAMENEFAFSVNFYYMARDYSYVEPHVYRTNEELTQVIGKSSDKWIVFSDTEGEKIHKLLQSKEYGDEGVYSVYLFRKGLRTDDLKKAYDYVIDEETIGPKVLVTTSLFDNGINIKNENLKPQDKVLNIAIDKFDREQFIQMLGRVRAEEGERVQLYIKEYSLDALKRLLKQDASSFLEDLRVKLQEETQSARRDTISPRRINFCRIYKYISRMSSMLAIIRNNEPDYCIDFANPREEASKGRVYEFYKTGKGQNELWSRNIVDLFESSMERMKRKKYVDEDIDYGERDVTRHESKLRDTFVHWLYGEKIPEYYKLAIRAKATTYLQKLTTKELNRYRYLLSNVEKQQGALSLIEKVELLQQNFDFVSRDVLINMDRLYALNEAMVYHVNLAERIFAGNAIDEQLNWIGKTRTNLPEQIEDVLPVETLEDVICSYALTQNEIKSHEKGQYIEKAFLQTKGIEKDCETARNLSKRYFDDKKLKDILGKSWEIGGAMYVLQSFRDSSSKHTTYYCFVKQE